MYNNQNMQPMYAQQGGGGGMQVGGGQWSESGQQNNNQSFNPQQYQNYGYSQNGLQQEPLSSANLFQQQLAQQQRTNQNPPSSLNGGNNYQSSAQAYMQGQQQPLQARQIPNTNFSSSVPNSSQSPTVSNSQLPPSQAPPYPSQQQQQQQPQQQARQMTGQEIMSILRGVNVQAMNPQVYATLTPLQQVAMREFIARSRVYQAQQQAQLGLGLPGSPAASTNSAQKPLNPNQPSPANGSPAPVAASISNNRPQQQLPNASAASTIGFLKILGDFCQKKGIPFVQAPVVEGYTLELPRLYAGVNATGGFANTNSKRLWGSVATALGFPAASADAHPEQRLQQLAMAYHSALYPFEQHVAQMQLERLQAARAAQAANGASPPAPSAPTPTQSSTSYASPVATQVNPLHPTASTSTSTETEPSRPTTASTSIPAFNSTLANKVASPRQGKGRRPSTASSRKGSVAAGDVKGKGRATGDSASSSSIKVEDFATPATSTPQNVASVLPEESFSASPRPITANIASIQKPTVSPLPEPPKEPPRRKRQKIEYVPTAKAQETVAGYDLAGVEDVLQQATRRKRPRTAYDLGLVDIHSLTMSLRSRLASEVSFALNSLTLISMSIRTHPQEPNTIPFPLSRCRDLYDELVDLLEETAFGFDDDNDDNDQHDQTGRDRHESPPETYPEMFQLITEQAGQLSPPDPDERNRIAQLADLGHTPLKPVDILLSVTNILRNLSIADGNSQLMGQDEHLIDVLARLASLPLRRLEEDPNKVPRWPVRLTPFHSMALKKDVLELLVSFGLRIRLEDQEASTAGSLFDLFSFFLLDAHRHNNVYFDLSQTPGSASRLPQPSSIRIAHYVDLGLAAFAQITLLDSNRSIISRLASPSILERLFDSLIRLVPVSEADFQILVHEAGLVYIQNLVMSLYNLTYLSPPELKLELRKKPAYIKSLLRVIRRLSGTGPADAAAAAFQPLLERCISILHLLSTLEGVTMGSSGMESSEVPWWGLSMSGWEEDDDLGTTEGGKVRVRPAQPTEADRGTVKQRLPPTASTAAGLDPGLPILSGETMSLFESLDNKSLVNVFSSLVTLL